MEEKGSLSKSNRLKDYKNVWKATNTGIINYRRAAIDHGCREDNYGEESFGEYSWPPKSYICSFCKREFRSAQALGGHMNVHRREKAKLRQITPQRYLPFLHPHSHFLDLKLDPNPNPNIKPCVASNTSSVPTIPFTYSYSCCLPFSDPCHFDRSCLSKSESFKLFRSSKPDLIVDGFVDFSHEKEGMIVKKSESGLLVESKFDNFDLDLELRLGCS